MRDTDAIWKPFMDLAETMCQEPRYLKAREGEQIQQFLARARETRELPKREFTRILDILADLPLRIRRQETGDRIRKQREE